MLDPNTTPPRPDNWSLDQTGMELVTKTDYHGNPYQAWQRIDKRPSYANLWEQFKHREDLVKGKSFEIIKADTDLHDEQQQLDSDHFAEQVDNYFYNQLNEDL